MYFVRATERRRTLCAVRRFPRTSNLVRAPVSCGPETNPERKRGRSCGYLSLLVSPVALYQSYYFDTDERHYRCAGVPVHRRPAGGRAPAVVTETPLTHSFRNMPWLQFPSRQRYSCLSDRPQESRVFEPHGSRDAIDFGESERLLDRITIERRGPPRGGLHNADEILTGRAGDAVMDCTRTAKALSCLKDIRKLAKTASTHYCVFVHSWKVSCCREKCIFTKLNALFNFFKEFTMFYRF